MRLVLFLLAFLAYGQDALVENLTFPPLARQAGIDGKVVVMVRPDGFEVLAGHFFLVPTAVSNLGVLFALGAVPDKVIVVYDFVMERPFLRPSYKAVQRGNALSRVFLRLLGRKTTRLVWENECINPKPPKGKNALSFKDGVLRVVVHHQAQCLIAEPAKLLAAN